FWIIVRQHFPVFPMTQIFDCLSTTHSVRIFFLKFSF
ncbi:unnamed protein product, partial [Larinioides sclopetarius]